MVILLRRYRIVVILLRRYRIVVPFGAWAYSRIMVFWETIGNAGVPVLYIAVKISVRLYSSRDAHSLTSACATKCDNTVIPMKGIVTRIPLRALWLKCHVHIRHLISYQTHKRNEICAPPLKNFLMNGKRYRTFYGGQASSICDPKVRNNCPQNSDYRI